MPSELSKVFGQYLLKAQAELGMTQIRFCKLIQLSRNQLYLYHKGESEADLALIERVAQALNKNPADLIKTESLSLPITREPSQAEIIEFIKILFEAKKKLETLESDQSKRP